MLDLPDDIPDDMADRMSRDELKHACITAKYSEPTNPGDPGLGSTPGHGVASADISERGLPGSRSAQLEARPTARDQPGGKTFDQPRLFCSWDHLGVE